MTKFFPGESVGKMHFDGWNAHRRDRVPKSDACMCEGRCIQNDDIEMAFGLLHPSNQLTFGVGLAKFDLRTQLLGALPNFQLDFSEASSAINCGLPLAKKIQVRPIKKQNLHQHSHSNRLLVGLSMPFAAKVQRASPVTQRPTKLMPECRAQTRSALEATSPRVPAKPQTTWDLI